MVLTYMYMYSVAVLRLQNTNLEQLGHIQYSELCGDMVVQYTLKNWPFVYTVVNFSLKRWHVF